MMRFERYLNRKKLAQSTDCEKIKIIKFRKGGSKKRNRIWKEEQIDQAKKYKCLGYMFLENQQQWKTYRRQSKQSKEHIMKDMEELVKNVLFYEV